MSSEECMVVAVILACGTIICGLILQIVGNSACKAIGQLFIACTAFLEFACGGAFALMALTKAIF